MFFPLIISADQPEREMRGVWLTSVWNIDWPHSTSVSAINQQNRLRQMLDVLVETNINAVLFQVRPNADALYRSAYEPWSHWITGTRGEEPLYDPLALVIYEAHKRGMEVHAWINPYRFENTAGQFAGQPGDYSQTHPELIFTHGDKTFFDPGIPATTQLIKSIIADLVINYDLDGVIFDDYFYPGGMPLSADQETYDTYGTDEFVQQYYEQNTRGNFRRASVNNMIREVNDTIKAIDPSMVFGVSPAGIYSTQASAAAQWGTTLPPGITGRDNYNVIFCDPLAWLHEGSVDYLSPQLYWPIGGPQDYLTLVEWWGQECERKGRHCYPSIGTYRLPHDSKTTSLSDRIANFFQYLIKGMRHKTESSDKSGYTLQEIENQILANRDNEHNNVFGSIFFSTRDLTSRVPNLAPFLAEGVFSEKTIFPYLSWLPSVQTGGPQIEEIGSVGEDPDVAAITIDNSPATRYLVYGWEQPPAKDNMQDAEFMQVIFGRDFSLFYPGAKQYFAVEEYMPNRELGFMSPGKTFIYMDPAMIQSPDNETVCDDFQFSWSAVPESEYYTLLIARQQSPGTVHFSSSPLYQNTYYLPSGLIEGQEHYITRVKAVSEESVSYSAPAMFFTGYPISTVLNAPADGAGNVSLNPTIQWNNVPGATHYHLQVSTDASFDPEYLVIDQEVALNFYNATLQDSNQQHVARVRAVNDCGNAVWSNVNSFTTRDATFISEHMPHRLHAYPNPSSGSCMVQYPEPLNERTIRWYTVSGRLVMAVRRSGPAREDHFDINALPAGFYTVRVHAVEGGQYVFNIIKTNE